MKISNGDIKVTEDAIKGSVLIKKLLTSMVSYTNDDVNNIITHLEEVMGNDYIKLCEIIAYNYYGITTCYCIRYILISVLLTGYSSVPVVVNIMKLPPRSVEMSPYLLVSTYFSTGMDYRRLAKLKWIIKSIYKELSISMD